MVEFALVLPMLLVLLLGVGDFARAFTAGIAIEAAARDAAEVVAQEYLRAPPPNDDLDDSFLGAAPTPGDDAYYKALHDLAALTACREARTLPGTTYISDDTATPGNEEACGTMPIVRTCIHDAVDTRCGEVAFGASVPASCSGLSAPMSSAMDGGVEDSRYVEVRICYQFKTLINVSELRLPLGSGISVGEIWLEKDRVFGVGYYPPPPTPTPPPPPPPPPPTTAPTESPTPTPSPEPSTSPTPTPLPTTTGVPTPTPELTPVPTPEPTQTPTPTPTPTPNEPTPTPTEVPVP